MNAFNILIQNAHGLNSTARWDVVRDVVDSCRPDIICLQDTKLAYISTYDILSILGPNFDKFVFLPEEGTRGGILTAWKGYKFEGVAWRVNRHSVLVQFKPH